MGFVLSACLSLVSTFCLFESGRYSGSKAPRLNPMRFSCTVQDTHASDIWVAPVTCLASCGRSRICPSQDWMMYSLGSSHCCNIFAFVGLSTITNLDTYLLITNRPCATLH